MIIDSMKLMRDKRSVLRNFFPFLGVEQTAADHDGYRPAHVGSYETEIGESDSRRLAELYRDSNTRLYELLDRDYNWVNA